MIREATEEDMEKIVSLQLEFSEHSQGQDIFLQPSKIHKEEQEKQTRKIFEKKNRIVYVAEIEGEMAGYVLGGLLVRPIFKVSKRGHISQVFVSEKYRGRGIGKALMEKFFERTKELGAEYVDLSVFVTNKEALDFYGRLGFHEYKKYLRKKLE